MWAMKRLLSRSTEEGSRQLVWAAIGVPEGKSLDQLRGAYINLERVEEPSDIVLGEEGKRREDKLWVCTTRIGSKAPGLIFNQSDRYYFDPRKGGLACEGDSSTIPCLDFGARSGFSGYFAGFLYMIH